MPGRQMVMFAPGGESTDLALMVDALAHEETRSWHPSRIRDALVKEAGVEPGLAGEIASEVESDLLRWGRDRVTTSLVRELVNVKLFQRGLDAKLQDHSRIGIPIHDLETMMLNPNRENSNTTHNPESINLSIAELALKQYALTKVFSRDVAEAHLSGTIHLHDLGMVNRPYCSGQSVAYVAKFGLNLPSITSISKPAKHPDVLLAHLLKMTSVLQNNFAGAIGWDAVNTFFAPYLAGLPEERIHQLAQMLIFEFNQLAGGRGGQVAFTDINLYYEIPKHFRDVPAIGPGGVETGKTYGDYAAEAKSFLKALFRVYLEGDSRGQPFFFPKPLLHITEDFFREEGWEEMLSLACELSAEKGNTYYVFDRGDVVKLSECCRLSFELDDRDLLDARTPWKLRFCALQNVTLNLPRLAYRSGGDRESLFDLIDHYMELAAKAHVQKREFLGSILAQGKKGPLSVLCMDHDGEAYLRIDKAKYLIGILGVNEMVQVMTGKQLHESEEALGLALAAVQYMNLKCEALTERTGLSVVLEQTPAESTAYRFAKLDLKDWPEAASVVKGDPCSGEVYYTNSSHIPYSVRMDPADKVLWEGRFHPMISAGAITHLWMGEHKPDPDALASFIRKIFRHTENAQVAFSPEFTICNSCGRVSRGLRTECGWCGSRDVDGITRITGYFTRTSSWNGGKRAELRDRVRTSLQSSGLRG
ncbi:anaerobic ribonucleoside-triphosphate reductase [Aminivibrio sp.]|uniref:anaerobic ribonucleoside-triphosphate reductase n=1 Tax=Aminivibrio sp. TaxID=1872489 RepID=UPI001A54DDCB|nr:anaerobic ribonucleoside-triphosphate reductase [Aminivibrio sp.]MBL3538736.1 anaerobic ribonucleoside-triphosphate reductase [Aminivibrio sp.]